jgi:hypothetical protein
MAVLCVARNLSLTNAQSAVVDGRPPVRSVVSRWKSSGEPSYRTVQVATRSYMQRLLRWARFWFLRRNRLFRESDEVYLIRDAIRSRLGMRNTRGRALHGNLEWGFRNQLAIALSGEKCERCQRVCEMFIEPAGVCTICWSILVLYTTVRQFRKLFERANSEHNFKV